ncbi:6715_t:CDS:2 [Dentiscutata heterogama]|uniref:6715_t:CDS:1 n=1 Tax=Dentiscutata heterogama TaxID=1316150 RepID=A0ACA9LWQ1_9GLOM|nr:6715_t:CDS:2 [Dentiscutata heterogama]
MSSLQRKKSLFRFFGRKRQSHSARLPADCLYDIFNLLKDDIKSLHSCILVNRLWCETAIPYLWSHPFKRSTPPAPSLISVLVACLSDDEKSVLVQNGIKLSSQLKRPPTFDYASFIPHLSLESLYSSVQNWTMRQSVKRRSSISSQCISGINTSALSVYYSLCRLLFGNISTITSLKLDRPTKLSSPTADDSLGIDLSLQNIKNLTIRYTSDHFLFDPLLKQAENIEYLSVIKSSEAGLRNFEDLQYLSSLIFSQSKLRSFSLMCYDTVNGFSPSVLTPLASQADTLVSLILHGIPFPGDSSIHALTICTNLEELDIRRCTNGPGCQLDQILNVEFPNLRKVKVVESSILWGHLIASAIQKNPTDLEELHYQPWEDEEHDVLSTSIIQSITKWQPKLKKFGIALGADEIPSLIEILNVPGCKLEFLSLFSLGKQENDLEKIWPELGKSLPTTLKHLNIWIFIGARAMNLFLKNTKAVLDSLYVDSWFEDYTHPPYINLLSDYLKDRPIDMDNFFHPVLH